LPAAAKLPPETTILLAVILIDPPGLDDPPPLTARVPEGIVNVPPTDCKLSAPPMPEDAATDRLLILAMVIPPEPQAEI